MTRICICGHFAKDIDSYDGQTIKTRNIYDEIAKKYGEKNIDIIDTYHWKKHPLKMIIRCIKASKTNNHIMILPAHKGVRVFVPFFNYLKKKGHFKLHYIVIGGWLYSMIKDNGFMKKQLKKIDYIYLENNKIIDQLKMLGLDNLYQMNNFKLLKKSTYKHKQGKSLKCCIFSRIEQQKGISDAIEIINRINSSKKYSVSLDIYGKVSDSYQEVFNSILEKSNHVVYKGIISPNDSVNVIEKYDLLLFPTKYYTEGIPGTIIDSYFAGVPVLSSKWENYDEIIIDNKTGIGYKFGDNEDFFNKLLYILDNREVLDKMRSNCLRQSEKYTPEKSIDILFRNVGE